MASIYAHNEFAKTVINSIDLKVSSAEERQMFLFGSQGPDLFFFNLNLKIKGNNPGSYIHSRPFIEYLDTTKERIKAIDQKGPEFFYYLGTIAHFILDVTIHPYVDNLINISYSHMEIESEFDRFLMLKDGLNPFSFKMQSLIPSPGKAPKILPIYEPYGLKLKDIYNSILGFNKYKKLFNPTGKLKETFILSVLKILKLNEYGGQLIKQEEHPQAEKSNKVLLKAYELALENFKDIFNSALDYIYDGGEINPIFYKNYEGVSLEQIK